MEPPRGFLASLWNFICFLPYFIGLLILGVLKGVILCPLILVIVTVGNSALILGLWPVHLFYTYYCLWSSKQLGPALKLVDGTWDTVKGSFTIVRDVRDVLYHSYFSIMDDLRLQGPPGGKYYEIRLLYIPLALVAVALGLLVDIPTITVIAACKFPYMLLKGWRRLFHDCIGREGPFLETICVPFAGLAILLWPMAVVGAFIGSMLASILLGAYSGVVVYQESSLWLGLCYIVASLSIYDEYSNDVLDMPEGSCFPRPRYRKKTASRTSSRSASFSRPESFKNPPSRTNSINAPMVELKPLELLDGLFTGCQYHGEIMVSKGVITQKDIEDAKSNRDSGQVISIGLPAYCILQTLIRSAKANSAGLLINDDGTEVTSTNRPRDTFYEWFLNPLLIIKDQIKAENISDSEEEYLGKLVLLSGDPERLRNSNIGSPPESDLRRAEFEALARRLRGITKSISRYPTFRRRFESSIRIILEELAKKNGDGRKSEDSGPQKVPRSKSMFVRMFSDKSFKNRNGNNGYDQEAQLVDAYRNVEIQ
ncbi:putative membrane protein At3g27390 isoform X2 [Nicotiana tabacum]|uniref:Membrane protein At3g27390 isoform X2 n=1 Tax=Nicotiana tabacum TaxID=4097 RepID=A0A1S4AYC5_TOBAC|nr:uncharacterized membrane protein At3g27390-like isoform X2 [Nicotiana tomentosiformis]XP_016481682.1 PREDICTED: uncharacterized membrane protein At3g27390-like isoform X2 [Nicotiana tabacum]